MITAAKQIQVVEQVVKNINIDTPLPTCGHGPGLLVSLVK
jgi:hypothetical protein